MEKRLKDEIAVLSLQLDRVTQELSACRQSLIRAESTITAQDLELAEYERGERVSVHFVPTATKS